MQNGRIQKIQLTLKNPVLIKKKENIFYLTGQNLENGYFLVAKNQAVFFGSGLEKVQGIKFENFRSLPLYLSKAVKIEVENVFTLGEYENIKARVKAIKPKVKFGYRKSQVDYQRQIKELEEIEKIKKSMRIVELVFKLVRKEIKKPRITEIKLAKFIQSAGLKMGAGDISFPPIVASGKNSAIPHHVPSAKKLKVGEPIIIDFGFKYKNYCSDFTRTVFLKKVHSKLEKTYNQVEKAYRESIFMFSNPSRVHPRDLLLHKKQISLPTSRGRNGCQITGNDLYQRAVDILAEKHLDKYFIHSLGHGTGLEIHESPSLSPKSKDILKPGMVFSIEPGVYIPKLGGVRIEDLVVLKSEGMEKFINISTKLKDNIL